ncbi:phospholipase A2 [Solenopsis invicta]|uniref:phospholipase A2 n=1 Tax=Solenopsis invicta TaxID=13686 RepID=UPI000595CAE4|nr:phospholipase A2 [Solenopsis invicta]
MSRVLMCFSVLFILSIAIQFGDCENVTTNPECEGNITLSSEKTRLSPIESGLKMIMRNSFFGSKESKNDTESKGISFWGMIQKIRDKIHFIAPGTLWCGDGDIAKKETDLGFFNKTDACCREHDKCQSNMMADQTEVNLINNGIFTRSSCTCDDKFYNCLKNVNRPVAFDIGVTYFDVLGQQCYKCICPTEDCTLDDGTECKNHCKKYKWRNSLSYLKNIL